MKKKKKNVLKLPIFSTGQTMGVEFEKVLTKKKSSFQDIVIVDTVEFGKCLVIDDVMQAAEIDHHMYDGQLIGLLRKKDANILILGGGDGYVAEAVLQKNPQAHVTVVDLDVAVIDGCREYMGQTIFEDPRVTLKIVDAVHYLESLANTGTRKKYDGVICDLTDAPVGRRNKKNFEMFYLILVKLAAKVLKADGWISVQAGTSQRTSHYIDAVHIIAQLLEKSFTSIKRTDLFIPSYGESCAFLSAKKRK